jgi:DNA-binding GntR family transcriptional regulator
MTAKEELSKLIMASYDQGVKDAQKEVVATIKQLTAVIRADEREACAKVCENSVEYAGDELARQIRARGEA